MQDLDIARWRLRSQHLVWPWAVSAGEAVGSLLAVQAENPSQAAWAVASRTSRPDQAELAALLDDGTLLRTHVLRPTWHFVRAEDAGWLLDLTGPRVRRVTDQQLRNAHGLDERSIDRAVTAVVEALASRGELTRVQLAEELRDRGIPGSGQMLMILLAHAELGGLICSGRIADGEHSYALMRERVPAPRRLGRAEALAELALRYFTGHGPATERDLAYWATLTLTDVRIGLEQVGDRLDSFKHDGRIFWHAPGDPPGGPQEPAAHLLQILDETYRGYQDSRWVLDAAGDLPRTREAAAGMGLVDAQLIAAMRRTVAHDHVQFDLRPYRVLTPAEIEALDQAARRYGEYLRLKPLIILPLPGGGETARGSGGDSAVHSKVMAVRRQAASPQDKGVRNAPTDPAVRAHRDSSRAGHRVAGRGARAWAGNRRGRGADGGTDGAGAAAWRPAAADQA